MRGEFSILSSVATNLRKISAHARVKSNGDGFDRHRQVPATCVRLVLVRAIEPAFLFARSVWNERHGLGGNSRDSGASHLVGRRRGIIRVWTCTGRGSTISGLQSFVFTVNS